MSGRAAGYGWGTAARICGVKLYMKVYKIVNPWALPATASSKDNRFASRVPHLKGDRECVRSLAFC